MFSNRIEAYSKTQHGNINISKNFKVREFVCQDGSVPVFIDRELIEVLQDVRDHFNRSLYITSGYRTVSHNKNIGGSSGSYHCYGMAADIFIGNIAPYEIYNYLDCKYPNKYGIGLYKNYVHIDVRAGCCRWRE